MAWHTLTRLVGALSPGREELDAADELSVREPGTLALGEIQPRRRAAVSGVLRALTYRPSQDKPVLVGRLFDGTGSVDLVWLGRRAIVGLQPGVRLVAEGMVVAGRSRPTIYNPSYELLGATR